MDDKIGGPVVAGSLTVNKSQVSTTEKPQQSSNRVHVERGSSDDEQVGGTNRSNRVVEILAPQGFLIKNNLGTRSIENRFSSSSSASSLVLRGQPGQFELDLGLVERGTSPGHGVEDGPHGFGNRGSLQLGAVDGPS